MMKFKRTIATGLAMTMIGSIALAGCGSSDTDSNSSSNTSTSDSADSDSTTSETSNTASESGEFTEVSLPLTEEKQTFTVWIKNDVTLMNACGGDLNNAPFFKELEERTNVHIEWVVPAAGSEQEQLNLMFSSGELTDLVFTSPSCGYTDGLDAAIDDGYFLDLTDLLPEYAPNYLAAVQASSAEIQKGVKTDSGRYAVMYTLMQEEQPPFMGFVVRQDWLDDLGLSTPVTYDDWENMLTKFKEEKGATAPLSLTSYSIWMLGAGMGAYGEYTNNFYQIDGTVYNSLTDNPESVREYLTLLNSWYEKGLIDPDFASATVNSYYGDSVLITTNNNGVFNTMYTLPSSLYLPAMDEGAAFSAILPPVKNAGDELKYRGSTTGFNASYAISADCANPELAIRWIDYLFSPEGSLLANYGVENETYTLDENGSPQYTDLMLNNPDGLSFDECMRTYAMASGFPSAYIDYKRELQYVPEQDAAMMDVWSGVTDEYYYPSHAQMTAEENAEYSNIYADISTFINENVLSFVTGSKSLDEFDTFIETLNGMGIDRCKELWQAALDRYNER